MHNLSYINIIIFLKSSKNVFIILKYPYSKYIIKTTINKIKSTKSIYVNILHLNTCKNMYLYIVTDWNV